MIGYSLFWIFSLLNEEWVWPPGMVRENSFCVYQRQNVAFFLYVPNYSTGMFQKRPSDNTLVYVANYSTGMFQKRPSDNILIIFVCVCVFPALLGCFIHCFAVPCFICKFSFL